MKYIIKYILIFITSVAILFFLLIGTAHIPREKIVNQIRQTEGCLDIANAHADRYIYTPKIYTDAHAYADIMLLNIIYYIDSDNILPSVIEAKYYSIDKNRQLTIDFNKMIDENKKANTQYMRYWHGSMAIIRPLLMFFNISQIYVINSIILSILAIILLIMLQKTKIKELVIAYILGLVMCAVAVVPFCLEYYWNFLIMFIVSIIGIVLDRKNKNMNGIFLVTGICTCYLDFLTTEIITLLVPTLIILTIRYKQKRLTSFTEGFKFLVLCTVFWLIGYIGMWFSKWILASIILKTNAFTYVIDNAKYIISGSKIGLERMKSSPLNAIIININTLFPIDILYKVKLTKILPICLIIIELILVRKKDIKKLWFSGLLLLIALIPYIRYAVFANHSGTHYFFTFRSQIISIMAIVLAVIYSIDKRVIKNIRQVEK